MQHTAGKITVIRSGRLARRVAHRAAGHVDVDVHESRDQEPARTVDPSRIAAGVITGIGFLGAGTIMRSQEHIRGLTTASTLWVAAALGLSIGWGFLKASVYVTFLVLLVLFFLRRIEIRMHNKGVTHGPEGEEERD